MNWRTSSYTGAGANCVEVCGDTNIKHDLDEQSWRKSGLCSYDDCVEVNSDPSVVAIRDSKNPDSPHIHLSRQSFGDLLDKIKAL